jgi:hypothetical protein
MGSGTIGEVVGVSELKARAKTVIKVTDKVGTILDITIPKGQDIIAGINYILPYTGSDDYIYMGVSQEEWVLVDSPEDLPIGEEVLCWDGCDYSLDYADMCGDTGAHYMANGTQVEAYKLLSPPKED